MKVLLIDDEPLILTAMRTVVRRLGEDVTIVSVPDVPAARQLLRGEGGFDLALLTVFVEAPNGFDGLAEMRRRHPEVPVVVLSDTDRIADVIRLIDMGAMGFVPRKAVGEELYGALAMVMSGGVYIPPMMLGLARPPASPEADTVPSVMRPSDETAAAPQRPPSVGSDAAAAVARAEIVVPALASQRMPGLDGFGLTPRQVDVLALLLKGLPNKLIARELNVTVDTVKDHVAAVLKALGVTSRTQAVLAVSQLTLGPQGAGWRPKDS